jgi:hypothetical protein
VVQAAVVAAVLVEQLVLLPMQLQEQPIEVEVEVADRKVIVEQVVLV